jgi:hypothetical protein
VGREPVGPAQCLKPRGDGHLRSEWHSAKEGRIDRIDVNILRNEDRTRSDGYRPCFRRYNVESPLSVQPDRTVISISRNISIGFVAMCMGMYLCNAVLYRLCTEKKSASCRLWGGRGISSVSSDETLICPLSDQRSASYSASPRRVDGSVRRLPCISIEQSRPRSLSPSTYYGLYSAC